MFKSKLKIAEKKLGDVSLGFIVGYPVRTNRWFHEPPDGFRALRRDTIFKTRQEAEKYRDRIEKKVKECNGKFSYEMLKD